jgi:hypothetical protein
VIAFMGSGVNESVSVWLGANGTAQKIATREIEEILATYTETQLSTVFMQERTEARTSSSKSTCQIRPSCSTLRLRRLLASRCGSSCARRWSAWALERLRRDLGL